MALVPSTSVGGGSSTAALAQIYDNVASGAIASWDVTGIAATYTHLQILVNARGDAATTIVTGALVLNNDTGANYNWQTESGNNVTAAAAPGAAGTNAYGGIYPGATATALRTGSSLITIYDYASTTLHKSITVQNGMSGSNVAGGSFAVVAHGEWASASAVNRITFSVTSGNLIAASRFTVYGLT